MERGSEWVWAQRGADPRLVADVKSAAWVATLYSDRRRPLAVVAGSKRYVQRGLRVVGVGLGLAAPIRIPKDWDGRKLALVGQEPARRHAKSASQA
jgi:hypothetical protein